MPPSDKRRWPRERVFSQANGFAWQPKDLHHHAVSVPCQAACPAGTDVPGYLEAIWKGDLAEAYRINLRDNVFPAVLGRICTRPCEPACRHGRAGNGEPVAICFAKRSADDFRTRGEPEVLPPHFPASGKTVGVVGAGAAGLAAARELARCGHRVTVYERHTEPGGLMVQGIPAFRLPREVVRREVDQVRAQGVEFRCNVEIGRDLAVDALAAAHDALVVAAGCWRMLTPALPGADLHGVGHGLPFLREANEGRLDRAGARVVVIGGGFTAVDCARMARRLGAEDVVMAVRRDRAELTVAAHELHQFELEGVRSEFRAEPLAFLGDETGRVRAVRFRRTRAGSPGPDGRPRVEPVPDSEFELPADRVLLCTGQAADETSPLTALRGRRGVFSAGDWVSGPGSLIQAIGHALGVAREVDRFLAGRDRFSDGVTITTPAVRSTGRPRERNAIPRFPMPEIGPAARFREAEVETGLGRGAAREEAGRCYFCHYTLEIDNELCIYCDRCLKVTPVEGCIVKIADRVYDDQDRVTALVPSTGPRDYRALVIDQDKCIRCGACAEVCPVECITLQKSARTRVVRA